MSVNAQNIKIAVIGLWHLGLVTAACMAAKKFHVTAYDDNESLIAELRQGKLPIYESDLMELVNQSFNNGQLNFTANPADLEAADLIWITYDTPIDANDVADVEAVLNKVTKLFRFFKQDAIVLISSQLPLGSTHQLQQSYQTQFPQNTAITFAYSPENLRLGNAIHTFMFPDRIVIGLNNDAKKEKLTKIFSHITTNILWMSVKSAEMTKHAINAFLATSVVFANELATLCEDIGANIQEVEQGLKTEIRIGPKAYLRAGNAFAGGTLARDLVYLVDIGKTYQKKLELLSAVISSNLHHRHWVRRKLLELFNHDLSGKLIAVMGLTYKSGTDTLRRSHTIETCQWLKDQGVKIAAYDPLVKEIPAEFEFINIHPTPKDAMQSANAVLISSEYPELMTLKPNDFISSLLQPFVLDAGGFLQKNLQADNRLNYITVGKHL